MHLPNDEEHRSSQDCTGKVSFTFTVNRLVLFRLIRLLRSSLLLDLRGIL